MERRVVVEGVVVQKTCWGAVGRREEVRRVVGVIQSVGSGVRRVRRNIFGGRRGHLMFSLCHGISHLAPCSLLGCFLLFFPLLFFPSYSPPPPSLLPSRPICIFRYFSFSTVQWSASRFSFSLFFLSFHTPLPPTLLPPHSIAASLSLTTSHPSPPRSPSVSSEGSLKGGHEGDNANTGPLNREWEEDSCWR